MKISNIFLVDIRTATEILTWTSLMTIHLELNEDENYLTFLISQENIHFESVII